MVAVLTSFLARDAAHRRANRLPRSLSGYTPLTGSAQRRTSQVHTNLGGLIERSISTAKPCMGLNLSLREGCAKRVGFASSEIRHV